MVQDRVDDGYRWFQVCRGEIRMVRDALDGGY